MHDDGTVDRVELTGLVNQATRTITTVVLRPTAKAVDAALLLTRALTPEPMWPGSTALARPPSSQRLRRPGGSRSAEEGSWQGADGASCNVGGDRVVT